MENEPAAGIGNFGGWLADAGLAVEICRPHAGEPVPDRLPSHGLIVLGGPMGAHDDHRAPWLPETRALLRQAIATETPTLGICLGAQLLAVVDGGTVEPGTAGPQAGLTHVDITHPEDRLFRGIASPALFIQWHFDAITQVPASAQVLAHSAGSRYEAFRIGTLAWGVSFHPEVEVNDLQTWVTLTARQLAELGSEPSTIIHDVRHHREATTTASHAIATNFAMIVKSPNHEQR